MDKFNIRNTLLRLCSTASISETPGELAMADQLLDILQEIDYFKQNRDYLYKAPLKGDPYGRSFVGALLKGSQQRGKTVILLSHFDVVSVEDYGALKEYAFQPEKYTELLKDQQIDMPLDAKKDLESGDYLFGRGIMDMKYGIALDIEIIDCLSKNLDNFPGNILFLSVPDEEANSAGMLGAVKFMEELKLKENLEYACCIVSEPHFPKYQGDQANYIYGGAVGKLLPVFYCKGKETHAGEPFSGLNPNLLTAKLLEKIELNPDLCETDKGLTTPAPVCLKSEDTKHEYSVQIPTSAYAYFNLVTLKKTPLEITETLKTLATEAFQEVLADIKAKADRLQARTGDAIKLPIVAPRVYTFSELYEECIAAHGTKAKEQLEILMQTSSCTDMRQLSIEVVEELVKLSPIKDPMIVLFYAPPYYPSCSGLDSYAVTERICKDIITRAEAEFGEKLELQPYFIGLSDMSYLGLPGGIDTSKLAADFPLWGVRYSLPLETMAKLNIPFVNIGPLGKDAHKYTERLCLSYSFDKIPKLVLDTVTNIVLDKI